MDWKAWENHKARGAKLSIEVAEQYATELILTRSIAAPTGDGNEEFLCNPASLRSISRSRRVMQTLGMIVRSHHLEYYYQAIYLLEFLHNLYPTATPLQDYGKLLVYLKVEAVIYEACCSMATNRVQAAQYLMKQLFDDYECDSYSVPDKQQLESMHNDGRIKLNQILASSNELRLSNLSVERLSSQKNHKAMCRILEGFFKGIDDVLPPPTIIQIIQDFQEQKSVQGTESTASNYVTPPVIPTQALMKGKSPQSKQFAPFTSSTISSKTADSPPDSPKATDSETDSPKTSRHAKVKNLSKSAKNVAPPSSKTAAESPKMKRHVKTASLSKPPDLVKEAGLPKTVALSSSKTTAESPKMNRHAETANLSKQADSFKAANLTDTTAITVSSSKAATDKPKTSTLTKAVASSDISSKMGEPSKVIASNNAHRSTQDNIPQIPTSHDASTQENRVDMSVSPDFKTPSNSPPKMAPVSPKMMSDSSQTREDASDSDNNGDKNTFCELKFISTHSRMKKTPVSSKRFVPLVKSMKCRRSLMRPCGDQVNSDGGKSQPKIKRVRIILSPLTKEEYMYHLKPPANKTGEVNTSPLQQKELLHKESGNLLPVTNSFSSRVDSTSDEDFEPPNDSDKNCTQRKRKTAPPVRYAPFFIQSEQSCSPKSDNSGRTGTVARSRKKRKTMPPVRYAPFAGNKRGPHNREQLYTRDSESVISESVTSSIGSDSPLVNLHT